MKRLQEMKSSETNTLHIADKDFNAKPKQTKVVLNNNDNKNEQNDHPETKLMIDAKDEKKMKKKKKKEEKEDDPLKTHPDGEWGWVVVGAAFLTQCIVVGLQNSSGVIFNELIKKYNESRGNTGTRSISILLISVYKKTLFVRFEIRCFTTFKVYYKKVIFCCF